MNIDYQYSKNDHQSVEDGEVISDPQPPSITQEEEGLIQENDNLEQQDCRQEFLQ